jgi:hypothetical protein
MGRLINSDSTAIQLCSTITLKTEAMFSETSVPTTVTWYKVQEDIYNRNITFFANSLLLNGPPLWSRWSEFLAADPEVPGSIHGDIQIF